MIFKFKIYLINFFAKSIIKAIFEGLKFNKSIKKLHLFANSMTGDFDYEFYIFDISAISSMRDALSVNTTIEELDIRNNGYFILKKNVLILKI